MKETYYLVRNNSRIQIRAIESAESGPLDDNHSAQPAAAFKQLKWHFQGRSWAFGPQPVLTAPRRHGHPCPPCSREAAAELFDLMGWTLERAGGSNPIPEPSATEAGRDRAAEGLAERRAESRSGKTRPSTRGTAPRVPQPGWSRGGFRVSPEGPESCRVCVFPPLRFGERRRVLYSEGMGVGCGPRRAPQPRRASRLQGQRPEQPRVRALSGRAAGLRDTLRLWAPRGQGTTPPSCSVRGFSAWW